ncbi:MAG: TlpA family protein disulfide reductase [Sciscionella sp.]
MSGRNCGGNANRRRAACLLACCLAVAVLCSCGSSGATAAGDSSPAVPAGLAACTPAGGGRAVAGGLPDLTLTCLGHGPGVRLAALRGPALINLWASWCAPCGQETPMLQHAYRGHGTRVRFFGIDTRDLRGAALGFLRAKHVTYQQLSDKQGTLAAALHAPGLPVTVAIDTGGKIVWHKAGQLTSNDLLAALRAATGGVSP